MSRSQLSKSRKAQKKKRLKKERDQRSRQLAAPKLSHKVSKRIDSALDLAAEGDLEQAKEALSRIASRGKVHYQVIEAQLSVAQKLRDHEACCQFARRLCELRPSDSDALLMYAQSSMYCGRVTVALLSYESFLAKWPDHRHAENATEVIPILQSECKQRIEQAGFAPADGMRLQALHEESLGYLQRHDFSKSEELCREIILSAPSFCSARNNLAIVQFHQGRMDDAMAVAKRTTDLAPDNLFAQVLHAKLCFLSGDHANANDAMDSIAKMTPEHQDVFVAQCELLGMLGRDDELVNLCESVDLDLLVEPHAQASRLHFAAYAHHRLGNLKKAKKYRAEYCKLKVTYFDAEENLDDIENGDGHAPWGNALAHWIPRAFLDQLLAAKKDLLDSDHPLFQVVSKMVPALLDRGDPAGRGFALNFAKAVASDSLLDALRDFAYGHRGPDAIRHEALMFLNSNGHLDSGPHRVYFDGKWREIQLLQAEIYWEPDESNDSPEVRKLYEEGHAALVDREYERAEECFDAVLDKDEHHISALYNRCTVWMHRDGDAGWARAKRVLENLHRDHPDYVFARTTLVNYLLDDGKVDEAKEMLVPVHRRKRLHVTEARALFSAQAEICQHEGDLAGCQRTIDMLANILDENDATVIQWRQKMTYREQYATLKKLSLDQLLK